MSIQITTGTGSLLALGFSVGDLTTLWSLARKVGNWMSAASGDEDLLKILDQDELDILRRRGLIDIDRFNKIWGSTMALLGPSGVPVIYKGEDAEKSLDRFGRFTAVMVCTVAALDAFALETVVKSVIKKALVELLHASEYGEDILASQCTDRINAWRSAARLRGLKARAEQIRLDLLRRDEIVDGLMPIGDSPLMVDFLVWLLTGSSDIYTTPSSDVAGVGKCLSELGIDILSVEGMGTASLDTPCKLVYSLGALYRMSEKSTFSHVMNKLARDPSTTVSLISPEESLTKFPVDIDTANRCRGAWTAGQGAANFVGHAIDVPPPRRSYYGQDLKFVFFDKGSPPARAQSGIHTLASAHGFFINNELLRGLEITFQHESLDTLKWLMGQTIESMRTENQVWNPKFKDICKIHAFTVFQAFFMGYYYAILLKLVDTSTLQVQTVDGSWGFRDAVFLTNMRTLYLSSVNAAIPGVRILRREDLLSILATLLFSKAIIVTRTKRVEYNRDSWCLGIIGKRALVVRSLLKPCRTIREVGSFILLDVDASGIPTDSNGVIRPGVEENWQRMFYFQTGEDDNRALKGIKGKDDEDVTFHIEADWEGNPETVLLAVRYCGRRITTINPGLADRTFCDVMIRPVTKPSSQTEFETVDMTAHELLSGHPIPTHNLDKPVIIWVSGRPRLQYLAAHLVSGSCLLRLESNCLQTAIEDCREHAESTRSKSLVIIKGDGPKCCADILDWVPDDVDKKVEQHNSSLVGHRKAPNLLGDSSDDEVQ